MRTVSFTRTSKVCKIRQVREKQLNRRLGGAQ